MNHFLQISLLLSSYFAFSQEKSVDEMFEQLNKEGYDKTQRPFKDKKAVDVILQVMIWSIKAVNEYDFTYDVSYLLNMWWIDDRLKHNGTESVSITDPPEERIWYPSIMLTNSDDAERVGKDIVTEIKPDGSVYISQRIKAKCTCIMKLAAFPMDTQHCPLAMESYAYSAVDLNLMWHKNAVLLNDGFGISGYEYNGERHKKLKLNYTMGEDVFLWDHLLVKLALKRNLPYYIYRIYIPSVLLMVFTVGSYWLPTTGDDSGRVGLIVTTFLAMIFVLQCVTEEVAKTRTPTALHVFVCVNITFIVLSILEYLLVMKVKRRCKFIDNFGSCPKDTKDSKPNHTNGITLTDQNGVDGTATSLMNGDEVSIHGVTEDDVHYLDKICRYLMPLVYFFLLIIYFAYYMNYKDSWGI